ncbi:DUF1232 domain-containing protein [Bacillus sp. FJAT-42376]|nr:YkvA family protein [Bacillus sp. FJAT-42376]AZB44729.1 DUF1232 domain-containing protein [Bacillus sp. FJAT-42376]
MCEQTDRELGPLLKSLLKEKSLSIRKFSELTKIDKSIISKIINGKRKARPEHLKVFADHLEWPLPRLFAAAGYSVQSEPALSAEAISSLLKSSGLDDEVFTIANVEKQLAVFEAYGQTEEGKETILNRFKNKIQLLGSAGPFIHTLKGMYEKFCLNAGSPGQIASFAGVLLYFIVPVDVLPDYLFAVGYLDDAMAVHLVSGMLQSK